MVDGRARARPELSKDETRLAHLRLEAKLTQKQMAELTGMSLMTYRRLERAEIDNPPLRHLVNCHLVLRSRLPDLRLGQVIEPRWLQWFVLDDTAPAPPDPPKQEPVPPLFPD